MSYKLDKPCSEKDRLNFVVEYNHKKGLKIEETQKALFALESNEILSGGEVVIDENYNEKCVKARKENFEKEFFLSSLGWIRRNVNMKDGSIKNFLSDLLLPIKAGLELGQEVIVITYKTPDFNQELNSDYMISLQERKPATSEFVQECLIQLVNDFGS